MSKAAKTTTGENNQPVEPNPSGLEGCRPPRADAAQGGPMPDTPAAATSGPVPPDGELPAVTPLTPDQIEELKARAAAAEENWDRFVRTAADLENFKKRVARERQDAEKFRHEPLLRQLLPVLDNLDLALAATRTAQADSLEALKTGVTLIGNQLRSVLTDAGLEEIDATGKPFDPSLHEAVSQQVSTEVSEGQVIQQLRKGFKYRDRLLRPAAVVVASRPRT